MKASEFYQTIQSDYVDDDGMLLPSRNTVGSFPETGNGLMYISVFRVLLARIQLQNGPYLPAVQQYCFDEVIKRCQVQPGLYSRGPNKREEQIGIDDVIGLVAYGSFPDRFGCMLREILQYYDNHCGFYSNVPPHKKTLQNWFGFPRYYWLRSLMLSGLGRAGFFQNLLIAIRVAASGTSSHNAAYIKGWLIFAALGPHRSTFHKMGKVSRTILHWSASICRWSLARSKYRNMVGVFADHFGPDHPFTKGADGLNLWWDLGPH